MHLTPRTLVDVRRVGEWKSTIFNFTQNLLNLRKMIVFVYNMIVLQ